MATDVSYEAMVVPFLVATLVYPCITIVSLKLSSQLFGAACVTSFVQAAFVTPFIVPAFWELMSTAPGFECYANSLNLALLPSNATTVFVCATVCGYFVQDCVLMFVKKEAMMKDLGGLSAYVIMWIHHIFSLFIWPYSVVEGAFNPSERRVSPRVHMSHVTCHMHMHVHMHMRHVPFPTQAKVQCSRSTSLPPR